MPLAADIHEDAFRPLLGDRRGSGREDPPPVPPEPESDVEYAVGDRVKIRPSVTYTGKPTVAGQPATVTKVHVSDDESFAHEFVVRTDSGDQAHVYASEVKPL